MAAFTHPIYQPFRTVCHPLYNRVPFPHNVLFSEHADFSGEDAHNSLYDNN